METLPTGTVTFLFTDIEGSTKLAQEHPDKWELLRGRHHAILKSAMDAHNGYVFQIIGDAFCVAFHTAGDALRAAVKSQINLHNEDWGDAPVKVRMGIHTGEAKAHANEYHGYLSMSLVQRVMSAGHGGQILLSNTTENLLREQLPKDVSLRDMGEHRFKNIPLPVRVFQVIAPDLQSEFPALRALDVFPNNLPVQLTSFVGREKEIAEVKQLLTKTFLLTLTGSGGTGKTRLSLQVAAEILNRFKDGVWFIELAPISDPGLVLNTIANILGVREEPGRLLMTTLLDWLGDKEVLLILDNCEHLIDASARFADTVSRACRGVRILASSREALGITGETAYRVPSLPTPDLKEQLKADQFAAFASVQLFIERAALAHPIFKLTNENVNVIAQICQRLDGIPLAIELAAARVRVLSVEQIAERLDDRFRLLTGGSRTALPRQQTLRALIDWSYNLLPEEERLLFRRLAVFVGGWTLDAAESVCGGEGIESVDILDLLAHLVDKSLVNVENVGEEVRYHRLETIRQYAREKLFDTNEAAVMRDKHLEYFLQLAEQAEKELQGRTQKKWLARLEMEHDNMRAALEWSLTSKPDFGLRIAGALREFWDTHGHLMEARQRLETLLDATKSMPPDPARVKAMVAAMGFASRQTDLEGWRSLLDQGLALAEKINDKWGIAQCLTARGLYKEYYEYDIDNAEPLYKEALNLARELGDRLLIGQALGPLASCALKHYEYERAESIYRESLALFRQVENEREIAGALGNLAEVAFTRRAYDAACAFAEESLTIYRELEDKHGIATALRIMCYAVLNQGRVKDAQMAGEQSVFLFRELSDRGCMGLALSILARSIQAQGDLQNARTIAQEAATVLHEAGDRSPEIITMDVLGRIALAEGDASKARVSFQNGLILLKEIMDIGQAPSLLEGLANALVTLAQIHDAILLLGAAEAIRERIGLVMMLIERLEYDQGIAMLHAQIDNASFQEIWNEGCALTMEQAIELALEKMDG